MNKISLCNEVIAGRGQDAVPFETQCAMAADMGYDGLEIAPFTLCSQPKDLDAASRKKILQTAKSHQLEITGLHWLLVSPEGLSITTDEKAVWDQTLDVIKETINLCRDFEGRVLVHGSPVQRKISDGDEATIDAAKQRAIDLWGAAGAYAERQGLVYCIEPLARMETSFVNTVEEAIEIVKVINSSALQTMIDTSSAGLTEEITVSELIRKWVPQGNIAHIQLNSTNRGAPGDGDDPFCDILTALQDVNYDGVFAIEPFSYKGGGPATASRAINYVTDLLKNLPKTPGHNAVTKLD